MSDRGQLLEPLGKVGDLLNCGLPHIFQLTFEEFSLSLLPQPGSFVKPLVVFIFFKDHLEAFTGSSFYLCVPLDGLLGAIVGLLIPFNRVSLSAVLASIRLLN